MLSTCLSHLGLQLIQVGYSPKFDIAGQLYVYSNNLFLLYMSNFHKIFYQCPGVAEHKLRNVPFHGGMHNNFKHDKLFCAFPNISLNYNLGNHFIFEQLIAVLFMPVSIGRLSKFI